METKFVRLCRRDVPADGVKLDNWLVYGLNQNVAQRAYELAAKNGRYDAPAAEQIAALCGIKASQIAKFNWGFMDVWMLCGADVYRDEL